jgi:putative chitinase
MKVKTLAEALGIRIERAAKWQPHIDYAMAQFGITTINEKASFLAQIGHESALLSMLEENLNYSDAGLARTWPKRFSNADGTPNIKAKELSRRAEKIANFVYANRMGNGSESSGDGWKYRGRSLIHVTGKDNYAACGKALGLPLLTNPEMLLMPREAARAAGWFWKSRNLDLHDDDNSVLAETRIINGGTHGLKERQSLFAKALEALKGKHVRCDMLERENKELSEKLVAINKVHQQEASKSTFKLQEIMTVK